MDMQRAIEQLQGAVAILQKQVEELQGPKPMASTRTSLAETDASGNIPRGKYIGMLHRKVVELDPWYVQWLSQEGKAAGLGFTDAQIDEALNDPRPQPLRVRR